MNQLQRRLRRSHLNPNNNGTLKQRSSQTQCAVINCAHSWRKQKDVHLNAQGQTVEYARKRPLAATHQYNTSVEEEHRPAVIEEA